MKSDNNIVSWFGTTFATIFTAIQMDELLKWISLGLTIISVIVSISYNIYKWYKRATADKRITAEEVGELIEIINDNGDKLTKTNKGE